MSALLGIGGFLLSYWWIAIGLAALGAVAGFVTMGRSFLDVLKAIIDFFRSPVGQIVILALVLWLAASYGASQQAAVCESEKWKAENAQLRLQMASAKRAYDAKVKEIEDANKAQFDDALRAAVDAELEKKNQEQIDATPKRDKRTVCLDGDASRRVRNVR